MTTDPSRGTINPPRRWRWGRIVVRCVLYPGVIWLGLVAFMKSQENRLVYPGAGAGSPQVDDPTPGVVNVTFASPGRPPLSGRFLSPRPGDRGVILFSHGNGANVSRYGPVMADLQANLGRGVFAYDYPGYGLSGGEPTEAGCYAAGDAAYRWLTEVGKVPADRVVLMGESLGGGVTVDLASRHDHAAMVLVCTFTSLPEAAANRYPWLPCRTLMSNRFDSLSKIGGCRRPTFIAHGTEDGLVPFSQAERLFAAASEPKEFLRVDGAGHAVPYDDHFYDRLRPFLNAPR